MLLFILTYCIQYSGIIARRGREQGMGHCSLPSQLKSFNFDITVMDINSIERGLTP